MTRRTRSRRLGGAAVGVLVAAMALLGAPAPASAHNYMISTNPEVGSTIDELVDRVSITTNAPLLDAFGDGSGFAVQVIDADGRYYGDGCVTVEGATVYTTAVPELGAAGEYTVLWQVVSEDGHTVSDEFAFTWAGEGDAQGAASPPACGEPSEQEPATSSPQAPRADAELGDVLWIGGAVVAVLVAAGLTVLLLTRRRA